MNPVKNQANLEWKILTMKMQEVKKIKILKLVKPNQDNSKIFLRLYQNKELETNLKIQLNVKRTILCSWIQTFLNYQIKDQFNNMIEWRPKITEDLIYKNKVITNLKL